MVHCNNDNVSWNARDVGVDTFGEKVLVLLKSAMCLSINLSH